jgi:hypothetical protein
MFWWFLVGVTTWTVRQGYKPSKAEINYTTSISEAMSQSRAGDNIDIYPGTYIEDIQFPFPLNVIGRSRDKVIIRPKERNSGIAYVPQFRSVHIGLIIVCMTDIDSI